MSLEEKLAANTAALEANTAALKAVAAAWNTLAGQAVTIKAKADTGEIDHVSVAGHVVAEVKPAIDLRPANVEGPKTPKAAKAEKPAATPPAPAPAPAAPAVTESASASPSEVVDTSTTHSVTLEDVQAAMKLKVQDFRAEVIGVFASFGVKKASELAPAHYQAALTALNAIGSSVEEDLE